MPIPGNQPGPSWYDSAWRYRWPVAVDAVTGSDSGSVDITFAIPEAWDHFWDNVTQASGYDIIVCGSDGRTLLTFDYNGLNLSTRTLTVEIDNFALNGTGKMEVIWLYWGNSAATDQSTAFAPSSPLTGYIELSGPAGYSSIARMAQPNTTTPLTEWQKKTTETIRGWVDLSSVFSLQAYTYNGQFNSEGPYHVTVSAASPGGPTVTNTLTRYTYYENRFWAIGNISAGTTATTDALVYTTVTTDGRTLDYLVGISIDDI